MKRKIKWHRLIPVWGQISYLIHDKPNNPEVVVINIFLEVFIYFVAAMVLTTLN